MKKLLQAIAELKCSAKSRLAFQTLVKLSEGFEKSVAILVSIEVALEAHDFLYKEGGISNTLKEEAPQYHFYYCGATKELGIIGFVNYGVMGSHYLFAEAIIQQIRQKGFEGKAISEIPSTIIMVSYNG